MTTEAVLDGVVLARSDSVTSVDGYVYFPPETVMWEVLSPSTRTSRCWWKGTAGYYDANVGGRTREAVGWSYDEPTAEARHIERHVAFWGPVEIRVSRPAASA